MTYYATCTNCAADKASCARRDEIKTALRGTGITSVKFKCANRQPMFHAGQRVSVTWPNGEYDESWPATIITEVGTRFLISVDDTSGDLETPARDYVKNERLFAKVSPVKLRALDEPDRAICEFCGTAPGNGVCPEIGKGWDGNPPRCILLVMPEGLRIANGRTEFLCRSCDQWAEWPSDISDYDPDDPHNMCGGSPWCCP